MNYLGLNLSLADDCDPMENVLAVIEDWEDLFEAFDNGAPGIARSGLAPITDDIYDGDWEIRDEEKLRAWVERRLTPEEWAKLHAEVPEHVREYEREEEADMADWRASR